MITLQNLSKKIGTRILFDDVCASFNQGHRYGLTGPNGSGKSTLLKIMMGTEEPSSGTASLPKKIGFLRQDIEAFKDFQVIDAVIAGNQRLWEAMTTRDNLYEQEMTDEIGMKLAHLEEVVAEEDGYNAESDAESLLSGMDIDIEFHNKKMHSLPNALQFRVLLCQALFGDPEALLLDEPTNHLDLKSIGWLEIFLHEYPGTLIVVSHDRHFLNVITTHIADIDYDTIITYPGNYDTMLVAKTSVRSRAEQNAKSKEKKIEQLQDFVSRFGAGTRASQVQSRMREIQRLKPQELKKSNIQRPYIHFKKPDTASGKLAITVKNIEKSFDNQLIIPKFSIEIMRGDKIGVIGPNGIGKTTLLRMLKGELEPDKGSISYGHQVKIGYFPQKHEEFIGNDPNIQLFDWLKNYRSNAYDQEIRSSLGKMLFSGDDAFKTVSKLSGGETCRLIFAALMLNPYNALILDEPNNHLDLESVSALGIGISDFSETCIVASHDRELLNTAVTKIIAIHDDYIKIFEGSLDAYLNTQS